MNTKLDGQIADGSNSAAASQKAGSQTDTLDPADLAGPRRFIDAISPEQLVPDLARKLPLEFLKSQCAIPLTLDDGTLAVALAEPLNIEAYDAIVSVLNQPCIRVVCPADQIEKAISLCYYQTAQPGFDSDPGREKDASRTHSNLDVSSVQTWAEDLLNVAGKAPAIKLVNKILFDAVHSRASDIHIEPYENEARVRFRIDGVLHDIMTLPCEQVPAVLSRLKVMANLNIAERRLPQDGQSRIKIASDLVDIRVSTIPTLGGERIMLRLLDKSRAEFALDQVGFAADLLERFRRLIAMPHGIILLTGPTGSGKTTSLYAALNELNCEQRNILTVEDPIEYQIPGIGQMQVKPKINLTFANCLRHILRQDPDVIMIGEIRDLETAEIAIQASLTGHLVLSTLHTNDSASAVTRLIDMGIEPYLISSSVVAIMAQRLVRVICPQCKTALDAGEHTIALAGISPNDKLNQGPFYKGLGCENCRRTGYLGRTAILEQLIVDDDIKAMITQRCGSHLIEQAAVKKGMATLRDDGFHKALAGITSLEEVYRVTADTIKIEQGMA
ncbi:MAG: type II secretion system ATPase GspE [Sedimentisphaerales bacterium]|nr:type II secretion system ATPase GspE [Sedimentisphaerales bacterium]